MMVVGIGIVAVVLAAAEGQEPEGERPAVALTFDDATDRPDLNGAILEALAQAKVRSVLFVAGRNVDSPLGLAQVRRWGEAGHMIGNHSYSHANLGTADVTLAAFQADVRRNEVLLRDLPGYTRIFRFPFLREGETAAKRDGFRAFLRQHSYRAGGVTIDASDWYYAHRFVQWKKRHPGADPAPYRKAYLDHLWDRTSYYDGLARKLLRRSVKHTLLLHTNQINAAFLPDVIAMYRQRGWQVIDAAAAFADPVYAARPRILPAGQSVIWALAREKGEPNLRFPGETEKYEKPLLDAAGL